MFQLCSTVNQAEVWDDFTSIMRDVHQQLRSGAWVTTTLRSVPEPYKMSFNEADANKNVPTLSQYPRHNESSISLPTRLPSEEIKCHPDMFPRHHSANVINVEFDSFVNDEHTTLVNENEINVSDNISAPSDIPVNVDTEKESGNKFMKFFRRFLPCCKA